MLDRLVMAECAPVQVNPLSLEAAAGADLQRLVRIDDGAPHVPRGTRIVAQAFPGLAEVSANDVGKRLERPPRIPGEALVVEHRDLPPDHVPRGVATLALVPFHVIA